MAKKVSTSEKKVRQIRRKSRKQYSGEEKIRIVLDGLRGEESVGELCRREGITESMYCLSLVIGHVKPPNTSGQAGILSESKARRPGQG